MGGIGLATARRLLKFIALSAFSALWPGVHAPITSLHDAAAILSASLPHSYRRKCLTTWLLTMFRKEQHASGALTSSSLAHQTLTASQDLTLDRAVYSIPWQNTSPRKYNPTNRRVCPCTRWTVSAYAGMIGYCLLSSVKGNPDISGSTEKLMRGRTASCPDAMRTVILKLQMLNSRTSAPFTMPRCRSRLRVSMYLH
jgi:hypothetical protein